MTVNREKIISVVKDFSKLGDFTLHFELPSHFEMSRHRLNRRECSFRVEPITVRWHMEKYKRPSRNEKFPFSLPLSLACTVCYCTDTPLPAKVRTTFYTRGERISGGSL